MFAIKKKKGIAAILLAAAAAIAFAFTLKTSEVYALTSSSALQDAGKAYYYSDYRYLDDEDSVFVSLTYEEAVYLFQQEGTYLVMLGGSWCPNTTSIIDYVNRAAKQAGVDTVYNLDFRLDGVNSDTHIRETDGNSSNGAKYNYLYGELVSRYLTNLDDWVEYSSDKGTALTYTDSDGQEITVGKVQVPFLFLYNKDNTVRHYEDKYDDRTVKTQDGGTDQDGNLKKYPIVYGFERMVYRKSGTKELYTSSGTQDETTRVENYEAQLDTAIFSHITDGEVTLSSFTDADYIRLSYNEKAGEELFAPDAAINIKTLTYRQLVWLLEQDGEYLLFFGGSWSEQSRRLIVSVNDYAVKNKLTVYHFDLKLDGGYAKAYWGYGKDLYIGDSENEFAGLYAQVVSERLQSDGETLSFFAYGKDEQVPVYASVKDSGGANAVYGVVKAYAEKAGITASDLNDGGVAVDVPRIAALAVVVVAVAAVLTFVRLSQKKKAEGASGEESVALTTVSAENDGCGGCETEFAAPAEDTDGGCGCGGDDDGCGCGCC